MRAAGQRSTFACRTGYFVVLMAKPIPALDYLAKPSKHPAAPVCVLFGDESYLKRQALGQLRSEVLGTGDADFSLKVFQGDDAEPREIFDELATIALFGGGRRLVIVEEADSFVTRHRAMLESYAARPKSSGILVLDVKTWPSTTRLYKTLAESGLQIECKTPGEAGILKWLGLTAKSQHQVTLDPAAAERLLEIVGPEMGLLDQELAKLSLLTGEDRRITMELVEEVVGGWRAKTAWDMLDAAADGNARDALLQLDRLLLAGENPIALLGQIGSTLRRYAAATRLIQQAETSGRRIAMRQALELAGFKSWPAAIQKAERQLRQLGRHRAAELYRWLLEADLALKGTSSAPARARLVLEELIVGMSKQLNRDRSAQPTAGHR